MPLFFLHIPKTGGMAMRAAFTAAYDPWRRVEVYGGELATDGDAGFAARLRHHADDLDLIFGHFSYSAVGRVAPDAACATVLRDPIERVVSLYRHVCRTAPHHYGPDLRRMTIAEWVERRLTEETNNHQLRCVLSGLGRTTWVDDNALVDRAIDRLETRFAVVGIQEQPDRLVPWFAHSLAWGRSADVGRVNAAPEAAGEVCARDRAAIEFHNRLDLRLYQTVRQGRVVPGSRLTVARPAPPRHGPHVIHRPEGVLIDHAWHPWHSASHGGVVDAWMLDVSAGATILEGWAGSPMGTATAVVAVDDHQRTLGTVRPWYHRPDVDNHLRYQSSGYAGWNLRLAGIHSRPQCVAVLPENSGAVRLFDTLGHG